jgi:predicted nucleic acid-binding protein
VVLVVLDPNVLLSGLIAQGSPAEVVDLVRYGEIRAAACPRLRSELEGVLRRPRFGRYVESDEIDADLDGLRSSPHRGRTLPGWYRLP